MMRSSCHLILCLDLRPLCKAVSMQTTTLSLRHQLQVCQCPAAPTSNIVKSKRICATESAGASRVHPYRPQLLTWSAGQCMSPQVQLHTELTHSFMGCCFCRAQGRADAHCSAHKQRRFRSQGRGLGVYAAYPGPQQPSSVDCPAGVHPLALCQAR